MSKIRGQIIKSVVQLTKNIKLNKDVIQVNAYIEVQRLEKSMPNIKRERITKNLDDEDILCYKLACKS